LKIGFTLNGKNANLDIEPRETLAEVLRARFRSTGVKVSCESQVCGELHGFGRRSSRERVHISGLTRRAASRVTTIEGLADESGHLHPLQQAFLHQFAFQCGFCTPGMISCGEGAARLKTRT